MKAIILEDVNGMSRHLHGFFEKKSVEYVVVSSASEASEEYVKGQSIFLHFTNHQCTGWSECSDFLSDYNNIVPHIHIHTGDSCKDHLPKEGMGTSHFQYLGDMNALYEQMQKCVSEFEGGKTSHYFEECLQFENIFTNSALEMCGTELVKWIRENGNFEAAYFVDLEEWESYEENQKLAYLNKREMDKTQFTLHGASQEDQSTADTVVKILSKHQKKPQDIIEGHRVYVLKVNTESLGFLLIKEAKEMSFVNEDLFFYALNRFPRIFLEKKHYQKILEESYRDDVTSLYNQKYLPVVTENLIEASKQSGNSFSVLFIDVDFFKKVNDTKGHLVGSGILCELGAILKKNIRDEDYPFRYGGDEFLLLLANTDAKAAEKIAERIRAQVEAHEFHIGEHTIHITLSIGIASYPEHATTKEDVIELADQAMYYGKNKSRNIVFVAS